MKDYKEGYLIVWTNYISPCSDRSQKPLSMHTQFPPSTGSKWWMTNRISPCTWASHKAAHTIIQTLIIGWITPLTCLVCLCIVLSEIGGHFLQDILTHPTSSCANVRYCWDRNWARIFSFVKTEQCLLSLRFGLRYRCFFCEEISKIGSLRLHAAQAYSRHIFEHKINAV